MLKELGDTIVITDGHTRALASYLAGLSEIDAYWDEDDLDLEAYAICVKWCRDEGITSIIDLHARVVSPEEYQVLWIDRCRKMQENIKRPPYAPRKIAVKLDDR